MNGCEQILKYTRQQLKVRDTVKAMNSRTFICRQSQNFHLYSISPEKELFLAMSKNIEIFTYNTITKESNGDM